MGSRRCAPYFSSHVIAPSWGVIILEDVSMNKEQARLLFEALARVMSPIERTCEKALDTIKDDDSISESDRKTVKDSVKELLSGSIGLQFYLKRHYPEFDNIGEGEQLWKELRDKYDNGR